MSSPKAFSGLRLSAWLALLIALPSAALSLLWVGEGRWGYREDSSARSATQAAIAQTALTELERLETSVLELRRGFEEQTEKTAEAEARAQAYGRTLEAIGYRIPGLVDDQAHGTIMGGKVTGPRFVGGATLSAAAPEVSAVLASDAQASGAVSLKRGGEIWALGPQMPGGHRKFAVRALNAPSAQMDPALARSSLVALAEAYAPPTGMDWSTSGALAFALVVLSWFAAFFLAARRLGSPLSQSLKAAGEYLHGDREARAPVERGAPESREIARAVNALIAEAEQRRDEALAGPGATLEKVVVGLEALGNGDLSPRPDPSSNGDRVLVALELARGRLSQRLLALQKEGTDLSGAVAAAAQGGKKLAKVSRETGEVVRRLADAATEAAAEIQRRQGELKSALEELGVLAAAHRRAAGQFRAELGIASRRAVEAGATAKSLEQQGAAAAAVSQCLDLLGAIAATGDTVAVRGLEGAGMPSSQVMLAVRRARETQAGLLQEVGKLESAMAELGRNLAAVAASPQISASELDARIVAALEGTAASFARSGGTLAEGIRAIERVTRSIEQVAGEVLGAAETARRTGPELLTHLASLDLGPTYEQSLLDRLLRDKEVFEAASADESGINQIRQAADDARARLARMIAGSEKALDILREPRRV